MRSCIVFLVVMFVDLLPFQSVPFLPKTRNRGTEIQNHLWQESTGLEDSADHSARSGGSSGSPNLIWHGGNIMFTADTTSIFWGQQQC